MQKVEHFQEFKKAKDKKERSQIQLPETADIGADAGRQKLLEKPVPGI